MDFNKIVGISSIDGSLTKSVYECSCKLTKDGFRWAFKNSKDMELFIGFFEKLEEMSNKSVFGK